MDSSWTTVPAEEFCTSVRDGTHDSPRPVENGKLLVTTRHLRKGRLDLESAYRISVEDFEDVNRRSKVDKWDVLVSMIGTIGEVYLVDHEPDFAIKNIGLFKSRDEARGKWLYYYLCTPRVQGLLRQHSRGTTQQYVPLGELRKLPVAYPTNRKELERIVTILSHLDDKIELNRRMSETLEQLARAEFERVVTEKPTDGVPAGEEWTVAKVDDLARISSGKRPPSRYPRQSPETGVPIWGSNGPMAYTNDSLINERILLTGRVGTLGNVFRVAPPSWPSDNTLVIRPTNEQSFEYLYFFLQTLDLASLNRGSTQPMLAQADVRSQPIPVPPARILSRYNGFASRLFARIDSATTESQVLTNIRDSLLPKLISGELRIPEAEQLVSEVA